MISEAPLCDPHCLALVGNPVRCPIIFTHELAIPRIQPTMAPRIACFVIALVSSACAPQGTRTTLAQLSTSSVTVAANYTSTSLIGPVPARDTITRDVNVEFFGPYSPSVSRSANCAVVDDDLSGTLDGAPLTVVSSGGFENSVDDGECDAVELDLKAVTPHPKQVSSLVVRDSSAVWTIEVKDLLTNDFTFAAPTTVDEPAIITWPSAVHIDEAYVQIIDSNHNVTDELGTLTGNVITADLSAVTGPATVTIEADRTATATRCDGPAACNISIDAGADFAVTLP